MAIGITVIPVRAVDDASEVLTWTTCGLAPAVCVICRQGHHRMHSTTVIRRAILSMGALSWSLASMVRP